MDAAQIEIDPDEAESIVSERESIRANRKSREVAGRIVVSFKPHYRWKVRQLAEAEGIPEATLCRHLVVEALEARGHHAHIIRDEWKEVERLARLEWHRQQAAKLEQEISGRK